MKDAKELISEFPDKELKQCFIDIHESENSRKDIVETSRVIELAKYFRDKLNITNVNTLDLAKDLVTKEAARRWSEGVK